MKRLSNKFYKELSDVRSRFGETEYSRDQIVPAVVGLLRKHEVQDGELLRDAANSILDRVERENDDRAEKGLFDDDEHVKLGDANRIKRKRMNMEQMRRRKRVIDHNKKYQDRAWAAETDWIDSGMTMLEGFPPETTLEDVRATSQRAAE